ncbi:glycosyltransferase family 4 protein [Arenimonas aestuarii]
MAEGATSPAEAFVDAVLAQSQVMPDLPFVLNYAPVAQMNPFQRLLYSRAAENGFAVVPALRFQHLDVASWAGRSVIHLHWLATLLDGVSTEAAASQRIEGFRADLARWKQAGHRILWTMHNVLPHDCDIPEAEIALRRVIVEGADVIHLLSRSSADEARRHYALPEEKLFHVPHPSYEGWYANAGDRITARLDIGAEARDFVFVLFGSIQPYKGVLELVDAFEALRAEVPERSLKLVVAGKPVDRDYLAAVSARMAGVHGARLVPNAMDERNIQSLFNGCDAVVAPYQRTLNSGVALLAATFRRPLVAPRAGGVLETYADDAALLYTGDAGDTLLDAMRRALGHRPDPAVFDTLLATHRPTAVSDRFFGALKQHLAKCDQEGSIHR